MDIEQGGMGEEVDRVVRRQERRRAGRWREGNGREREGGETDNVISRSNV